MFFVLIASIYLQLGLEGGRLAVWNSVTVNCRAFMCFLDGSFRLGTAPATPSNCCSVCKQFNGSWCRGEKKIIKSALPLNLRGVLEEGQIDHEDHKDLECPEVLTRLLNWLVVYRRLSLPFLLLVGLSSSCLRIRFCNVCVLIRPTHLVGKSERYPHCM